MAQLDLEDLDKESLCSAASATLSELQEQLEMGYLHIQQKHAAIQTKQVSMQLCMNPLTVYYIFLSVNVLLYVMCIEHVASSKQRSSLRRAITDEKKKLGKCIQQYKFCCTGC